MNSPLLDPEETVRSVEAEINYLLPGNPINRRFVSAGVELNTGTYGPYPVTVRDGRAIARHFTLDRHGFTLADCEEIGGNFIDHRVYWKGSPDVSSLAGRPVRIHFKLIRAKLYSFQFSEE